MLTITLDTCCFDERCDAELKELKKLHEKGEIEVLVYHNAYLEKSSMPPLIKSPILNIVKIWPGCLDLN